MRNFAAETLYLYNVKGLGIWFLLLVLIAFRCCFETSVFHSLNTFTLIYLLLKTKRPRIMDMVLKTLGKHSMNMWLIHGFICSIFFHDWLYSFRYPMLIYVILIALSYLCSRIIERNYRALENTINYLKH